MAKVLVIQGAGMNMRGKSQLETFGPMTLEEMNEQILGYAEGLGVEVELFHSNVEGEVVNALYNAHDRGFDAALINPAGYTTGTGPLRGAITQVGYPVIEVHASNPTARGSIPSRFMIGSMSFIMTALNDIFFEEIEDPAEVNRASMAWTKLLMVQLDILLAGYMNDTPTEAETDVENEMGVQSAE